MTEREKMLAGLPYNAYDGELINARNKARELTRLYNATAADTEQERAYRAELLAKLFGSVGESPEVEPTFRCDYGCNIKVGNKFYANFDCVILDVCEVIIGDHVFFAPRVGVYTATHPVEAEARNSGVEFGKPIKIGDNVWVGGNAVILPGVTIGDNSVIGAGAVVTKDVPAGVVAAGNPCRVIRKI